MADISALDFALRGAVPDPDPAPANGPDPRPEPSTAPANPNLGALRAAGHRLLRLDDGRVFVTAASQLTSDNLEAIRSTPLEHLRQISDPWPPVEAPTTLAQLLGTAPPVRRSWYAQEPPSLDGIDTIILNFATDGLDWVRGAKPVGVTVSTLDRKLTRFLPFAFKGGGNLDEQVVKRWASEQLRGKRIVNANTRFDIHQARVWGVDLIEQDNTFSDILHTAALLDDHRKRFAIDVLQADYLPDLQPVPRVDETRHSEYAASDVAEREAYTAQLVGRLADVFYPQLDEQELWQVQDLEDEVICPVVEMEKNGSPIDRELLEVYGRECRKAHDDLLWEIAKEVGFAFDHTATTWARLFEHCGLTPRTSKKSKTGKATFAEGVISAIDNPLIKKAHYAGQLASLNSKIFKPYTELVGSDGILHYEINQLRGDEGGTVSGRVSIGYVQQVPNKDNHSEVFGDKWFPRRLFIPGVGDYLDADAAQIEYRIFASLAGNKRVLDAYKADPTTSFHRTIHAMILPFKPDLSYVHCKGCNFCRIYGGGVVKIGVLLGFITEEEGDEIAAAHTQKTDPRLAVAREVVAIYSREVPEIDTLSRQAMHLAMSGCTSSCRKDELHRRFQHRGFVKTTLGRRSRFPNDYKIYRALNRVISGSAADVMKQKLVELFKERKRTGFVMRLTVHDSALGDSPTPECARMVHEILNRQSFNFRVPLTWEIKTGRTWGDC